MSKPRGGGTSLPFMRLGEEFKKVDHPRWKFQLLDNFQINLVDYGWDPSLFAVDGDGWVKLVDGWLEIFRDFMWDGSSGLSIQTQSTMIASLAHDSLYQLLRAGLLGKGWKRFRLRLKADNLYRVLLRQGGASWFRSSYHFAGVVFFGGRFGIGKPGGFHEFRATANPIKG